jgi:DNA mismatch repair ATPase MutS
MTNVIAPPGDDPGMSPMLQEYFRLRSQTNALLAYQMGDFFEFYFEDAKIVASTVEIALTRRGSFRGQPLPMCGFPTGCEFAPQPGSVAVCLSSSQHYFVTLVQAGYSVAVAMQTYPEEGVMLHKVVGTFHPPGGPKSDLKSVTQIAELTL